MHRAVGHGEAHVPPAVGHAVHPLRVVLVPGTRVGGQRADQPVALPAVKPRQQLRREVHHQRFPGVAAGEAAGGVGIAVGIAEVGLDVQNGRAADHVRAPDVQHRRIRLVQRHTLQLHGGQPQPVGAEG